MLLDLFQVTYNHDIADMYNCHLSAHIHFNNIFESSVQSGLSHN